MDRPQTATAIASLTVTEAIETRRSVRQYEPEPIPREDLEEILRLTRLAPSANNIQPWRFVVVESPDLRARLQDAANGQRQVGGAPAVIVLYSDMADALAAIEETVHPGMPAERRAAVAASLRQRFGAMDHAAREDWGAAQSYIALGFLLLAARAAGYDTSPMLGFDAARVRTLLGLPDHARIPALVAIGRAAEEGFPHHRHPEARVTDWR